jgi:hypothetical protein
MLSGRGVGVFEAGTGVAGRGKKEDRIMRLPAMTMWRESQESDRLV